jgi:hypothetical protein
LNALRVAIFDFRAPSHRGVCAAAQKPEGEITEVPSYMFPKPGTLSPAFEKVSFVTKVGDLGCGVGYYK